jgi:transcriptional regulator with XRE-family HTH domain
MPRRMKPRVRAEMSEPPDPARAHQPADLAEVRRMLCEAMGTDPDEPWWLEEALRRIWAHRGTEERKRVYDISTPGMRLRTAREIAGWTQNQLAARTDLHPLQVSNYETGNTHCPAETFSRLCRTLRVSERWVLGDSDEGGPPCPKSGVMRRQFYPNWSHWSRKEKAKVTAKAALERLRGLRPPKPTRAPGSPQDRPEPAPESPQDDPAEG